MNSLIADHAVAKRTDRLLGHRKLLSLWINGCHQCPRETALPLPPINAYGRATPMPLKPFRSLAQRRAAGLPAAVLLAVVQRTWGTSSLDNDLNQFGPCEAGPDRRPSGLNRACKPALLQDHPC